MSIKALKRNVVTPFKSQNKVFKREPDVRKHLKAMKFVVDGAGKLQPVNELETRVEQRKWAESNICVVTESEIGAFFKLLDDNHIRHFLKRDSCYKLADKYLLAMVFVYFKRANYGLDEFTRMNFFVALYLAHYVEEDDEDEKYQILPWAVGDGWRYDSKRFFLKRDKLWTRMGHRAIVSLKTCEEYISLAPNHSVWQRIRAEHHTGAIRYHGLNCITKPTFLFGPEMSPPVCRLCRGSDGKDEGEDRDSVFSMMTNLQFPDFQEIFEKEHTGFQYLFVEE